MLLPRIILFPRCHRHILTTASLLALFLLKLNDVNGQACISGKVVNAVNGQVIAGANILVSKNTGCSTDKNGEFRLCGLPADSVSLTVSYMGYEPLRISCLAKMPETDKVVLRLKPAAITMDEVVVTATRTDNLILNTPVRVNLVSPRLLQSLPSTSIDDVLKYAPGINYSRPFGIFSTKAIVTMRGLSGKEQGRVLVLLDGIPLNKSDGGTVDWNMVDMARVSKVEVTKGAGSALYGGNAMGGVINIITKPPVERFFLNAGIDYGTYNTMGVKANSGGSTKIRKTDKSWYWLANTFYRRSDGYVTQSPADIQANPLIVIKSFLREGGAGLRTGLNFGGKHSIDLSLNYYNDHRGTGEKVYQEDGNVTDHDSYSGMVTYRGSLGKFNLQSSLFSLTENYIKVNEYLKDDYTWYDVLSVRRDNGIITTVTRPVAKSHLLTAGIDFKNGNVDAYDKYYTSTDIVYNEGRMNTLAFYAQDEWTFWKEKMKLVAGVRYDRAKFYDGSFRIEDPSNETSFMNGYQVPDMPEQSWNAVSPRVSLQYKWKEGNRVFAMASRGFRPSVLDDLCRSGRIKGGFKIANPSVKPEYLNNIEIGSDIHPWKNTLLSASLFYSRGKDFQYYVTNGQTIDMGFGDRPIFIRANISKVEIAGLEAEVKVEVTPSLMLFGNYSYTHSVILDYQKIAQTDTVDLSGNYLTDVPEHIISAGMNWENRFVNTSMLMHYSGPMYINDQNTVDEILGSTQYKAYTTVDAKFWRNITDRYRVSLSVQNLFNVKYYDSKYAVCPGRFIVLAAEMKL